MLAVAVFLLHPGFFLARKKIGATVSFPDRNSTVHIEVANTPYQWSTGLMFREALAEDAGMLFVFPKEEKRDFWMKNTLIPLDMVFISADKKIVSIQKNATPCTTLVCPFYASEEKAMYVLEVNAGFADRYALVVGDRVDF